MHTKDKGKPKKNNNPQAYSTPRLGPGPGPRPGPRPWGCCRLAFYCFSLVFLCFWYAYAIIGLEIHIRLALISNVCIIIPASAGHPEPPPIPCGGYVQKRFRQPFSFRIVYMRSGIIIHTFEIKSNLILISNPIIAYAYQKQRKT